ncbi:MAG: hypothetical protein ACHQ49_04740 [Elusimicrobiota bacterium]
MTRPSVVRREPVAVVLVIVNLFFAGLLLQRRLKPSPRRGLPPGHPDVSVPSNLAGAPSLSLSGLVKISPALKDPWPKGAHVFVIARSASGGPPYAVARYDDAKPPFAFALGPDNLMISGAPAPERLVVSVRVDQDGDAMTRQLGDLEGGPSAPVSPRLSVELIIDRPATLVSGR